MPGTLIIIYRTMRTDRTTNNTNNTNRRTRSDFDEPARGPDRYSCYSRHSWFPRSAIVPACFWPSFFCRTVRSPRSVLPAPCFSKSVSKRLKSSHTCGFPAKLRGAKNKPRSLKTSQTGLIPCQTSLKSLKFETRCREHRDSPPTAAT
jgi:hypothetical protein